MKPPTPFVLNNISISSFQAADAPAIYYCMQDKTISENTLRIPWPYTMDDAHTWLSENEKFEAEQGYKKNYAIRDANGLLMGGIGIHFNYGREADKSEFGYWLGKDYRNKGVITEAIKQFCALAKEVFKIKTLEAHVFSTNAASMRALLKAGFTQTAILPAYYNKDGAILDAIKFERQL